MINQYTYPSISATPSDADCAPFNAVRQLRVLRPRMEPYCNPCRCRTGHTHYPQSARCTRKRRRHVCLEWKARCIAIRPQRLARRRIRPGGQRHRERSLSFSQRVARCTSPAERRPVMVWLTAENFNTAAHRIPVQISGIWHATGGLSFR